jgi:hypothetical protein
MLAAAGNLRALRRWWYLAVNTTHAAAIASPATSAPRLLQSNSPTATLPAP